MCVGVCVCVCVCVTSRNVEMLTFFTSTKVQVLTRGWVGTAVRSSVLHANCNSVYLLY
jgi:hypothetical protein